MVVIQRSAAPFPVILRSAATKNLSRRSGTRYVVPCGNKDSSHALGMTRLLKISGAIGMIAPPFFSNNCFLKPHVTFLLLIFLSKHGLSKTL